MTEEQRAVIQEEIDGYVCDETLGGRSAPAGLLDALDAALADSKALEKVRAFLVVRGLNCEFTDDQRQLAQEVLALAQEETP